MRNFENWETQDIEISFNITQLKNMPLLEEWLHESRHSAYKQETKKGSSDPKGQLLAELLTAQAKNDKAMPLYGCYILGRSWFFLVLNGSEYAVSNALNASDSDIYQIIAILRKIKDYVAVFLKM